MARYRVTFEVEATDDVDMKTVEEWISYNVGATGRLGWWKSVLDEEEMEGEHVTVECIR